MHIQKANMKVELEVSPELLLLKELSALRKSRSLRDPSTCPSLKCPRVGFLFRKVDTETGKDELGYQASAGDDDSRTSTNNVPLADYFSGYAAGRNTHHASSVKGENDLGEREGQADITCGVSEHRKRVESGRSQSSRVGAAFNLHDDRLQAKAQDLEPKQEPDLATESKEGNFYLHTDDTMIGPSQMLQACKQDDVTNLKGYSNVSSGQMSGRSYGKPKKKATLSRTKAVEDSIKSEKERLPFHFNSTGQSKPWSRGMVASRKRNILRCRDSYLRLSSFEADKENELGHSGQTTPSQDLLSWRSPVHKLRVGAIAFGETEELEMSELPHYRRGIPKNCPQIHSRRHNLLGMAGSRSFCSDPIASKVGTILHRAREISSRGSVPSDCMFNTDSESLPLLEPALQLDIGSQSEQGSGDEGGHETESSGISLKSTSRQLMKARMLSGSAKMHCSLSQKYRPKHFHDIVGQHLVTQALSNALLRGKVAHMYLFYGPRGTGKTSCARVLARALSCISSKEQRPCGLCTECLADKTGKTSSVNEINARSNCGIRGIKALMHDVASCSSSQFKVYIIDECNALSSESWNAFLGVLEGAPKNTIFILVASSLEQLPYSVVSRCQKFLFSKIRQSEIVGKLQGIVLQEGLEADAEALKLIASSCEGSLQDAEMMLDQLSLLGQKISRNLVQELIGLIPDDKLVELLDFALSASTKYTLQSLNELVESGADPLDLISQLAFLITRILVGGYQLPKERERWKFFRKTMTKEDMEVLRLALKTLSEAEKQLRGASDRMTWLTAALLQFAPDQSYLLASSPVETSVTQSPLRVNEMPRLNSFSYKQAELQQQYAGFSEPENKGDGSWMSPQRSPLSHGPETTFQNDHFQASSLSNVEGCSESSIWQTTLNDVELEDVWERVLDAVHSNSLRKFLQTQGKLFSLSFCKGFAVAQLEFYQLECASRAERSRTSIAHAFQVTLGNHVEIKVHLVARTEKQLTKQTSWQDKPTNSDNSGQHVWMCGDCNMYSAHMGAEANTEHLQGDIRTKGAHHKMPHSLEVSGTVPLHWINPENITQRSNQSFEIVALESRRAGSLHQDFTRSLYTVNKYHEAVVSRSDSTRKSRLSLGFVIQQAEGSVEGYSQDLHFDDMNERGKRLHLKDEGPEFLLTAGQEGHSEMAVSVEEDNLILKSSSGGLLCWKTTARRYGPYHIKQLQKNSRRPGFLLNILSCANPDPL